MKYIQTLLLVLFGVLIYAILIISICPTLWFLGSHKPFRIIDLLEDSVADGVKKINK